MINFFNRKMSFMNALVFTAASSLVFLIALDYKNPDPRAAFLFLVLFFSVSFYFACDLSDGGGRFIDLFVINIIIAAAIYSRVSSLEVTSHDYRAFLHNWVEDLRRDGGFAGVKNVQSDYNAAYLYFLALFSYSKISDLYLIKFLSIAFDFILAVFSTKLVRTLTKKSRAVSEPLDSGGEPKRGSWNFARETLCFALILFAPTVWLNSSFWAQCDSIYAAFCAAALYFALNERPKTSLAMLGLAFSFKLQTLFFVPVFFVIFLAGKIRLRHIPVFLGTFALVAVPAVVMGMDPKRVVGVYVRQATQYSSSLNWNSPSIFSLVSLNDNEWPIPPLRDIGNLACFCAILLIIYFAFKYREKLNDELISLFTALLVLVIPFLLPQMHDRYFYLADVFSIIFAVAFGRKFFIPILVQAASFAAYQNYLLGYGIIKIEHGAVAILVAIYFTGAEIRAITARKDLPERREIAPAESAALQIALEAPRISK